MSVTWESRDDAAAVRPFMEAVLMCAHGRDGALRTATDLHTRHESYFLSRASIPAWAMASSTSDFAPLAAMAPRVWPSTLIGSPP